MQRFRLKIFNIKQFRGLSPGFMVVIAGLLACLLVLIGIPLAKGEQVVQGLDNLDITTRQVSPILVHAPIRLDGQLLFEVAAVKATPQNGSTDRQPLQERVDLIEANLRTVLKIAASPEVLDVLVETEPPGYFKIVAAYTTNQGSVLKQNLLTITPHDAGLYGLPQSDWAKLVARKTKTALVEAKRERQPGYWLHQAWRAIGIGLGVVLANSLIGRWQHHAQEQLNQFQPSQFKEPAKQLVKLPSGSNQADRQESDQDTAHHEMVVPSQGKEKAEQRRWQQSHHRLQVVRRSLDIIQAALWLGGFSTILGLFPVTRFLQNWLMETPAMLIGIWLGSHLVIRLLMLAVDESVDRWIQKNLRLFKMQDHQLASIKTFTEILKGLLTWLVIGLAILMALNRLGLSLGPVLVGTGILGFMLFLACQTLVQDVISGFWVLLDKRYTIGDWLVIAGMEGQVESINLRMTQLRGKEGEVITIPHRYIQGLANLTQSQSSTNATRQVNNKAKS